MDCNAGCDHLQLINNCPFVVELAEAAKSLLNSNLHTSFLLLVIKKIYSELAYACWLRFLHTYFSLGDVCPSCEFIGTEIFPGKKFESNRFGRYLETVIFSFFPPTYVYYYAKYTFVVWIGHKMLVISLQKFIKELRNKKF